MRTLRAVLIVGLALAASGCSERPQILGAEPVETRSQRSLLVPGEARLVGPPRLASFEATVSIWSTAVDQAVRESETVARRVRGQLENLGVRGTDLVDTDRVVRASLWKDVPFGTQRLEAIAAPDGDADGDADGGAEPVGQDEPEGAGDAAGPAPSGWQHGYLAQQTIQVVVRDLGQLPKVLERAQSAGAGRLGEVGFQPNNAELLVERVRQRAVQDARARAQVLAQELGQAVGQANSIVEEELIVPGDDPERPFEARCVVRVDFTLRGF